MVTPSTPPPASGYKTASNAVVTETEPSASEASTRHDDDYVYIRAPREKVVLVDTGFTDALQCHVPQSAGPQQHQSFTPFRCNRRRPRRSSGVRIPAPFRTRMSRSCSPCGNASVHTVDTEPHLEALTQHITGRLAVPCASAAAEAKLLMDSGSGITAMSGELLEPLRGQLEMTQTALTQEFVGHARVVTSLDQECTQSCPPHLTIEDPWGPSGLPCRSLCSLGEAMWLLSGRKRCERNSASTSWRSSRH